MGAAGRFGRRCFLMLSAVAIISLGLGGLLFFPAAAQADESAVAASFSPGEVIMVPGEKRSAVLLVHNPGDTAMTIDSVVVTRDDRVTVAVVDPGTMAVSAGGSTAIPATVELGAVLPSKVTITATVGYTAVPRPETAPEGTSTPVPTAEPTPVGPSTPVPKNEPVVGVALATLVVEQGTTPSAAPSPLTIVSSGDTGLADTQSVDVYFTIQNNSASPLAIRGATVTFPSFLQVEVPGAPPPSGEEAGFLAIDLGERLPAGDGAVVHLHVTAPRGLQPGDVLLVLAVAYAHGVDSTGLATGSHSLALTVFGESAVLGVFGAALAPALFVVPGVLSVLVLWFLWMLIYPKKNPIPGETPSPIASAVAVAILGVLSALALLPLYRRVFQRDPRAVYGFNDIGWMCLLGVAAGVAVWILTAGGRTALQGLDRRYRLREDDSARSVLRKLTRRGSVVSDRRLDLARMPAATAAGGQVVFILREGEGNALTCPAIAAAPLEDRTKFETTLENLREEKQNRKLYKYASDNAVLSFRGATDGVKNRPMSDLSGFGAQAIIATDEGG